MRMIEKILELMKNKGINAAKLTTECGLNHSALTEWKKGKAKPSIDALSKIAQYFGVSVDYLLGIEKPNTAQPTITGISIARGGEIKHYTLSEERMKYLQDLIETLEKDEKKKPN